jgi:hypothetical protein
MKLPVEAGPDYFRYGLVTGRRPGNFLERQLSELLTGRTRQILLKNSKLPARRKTNLHDSVVT